MASSDVLRTLLARRRLALGVAGVLAAPALLVGCETAQEPMPTVDPAAQADASGGVTTIVREVAPDSFRIEDERLVAGGADQLVIHTLDGATRRITDPDSFAALLPATPPPSDTAWAAAPGVAGETAGGEANEATAEEDRGYRPGFGLGSILLYSMLMRSWRPGGYAGYNYAPRPGLYTSPSAYERVVTNERPRQDAEVRRRGGAAGYAAARRSGNVGTRSTAPAVRPNAPSQPRSGFFGSGRSGRGIS